MNGFAIIALASALIASEAGQEPEAGPDRPSVRLFSFDDLQRRIGEPRIRILDARPQGDYREGHIPGAVWIDAKAVEKMAAKLAALADRAAWEAWIAPLGIRPDTEVVVYDANRQLDAARLWWLLRYLGVVQVGLIDGGFPLWKKQGRPVTADVPKVEPRKFEVRFRTDRLATRDAVLEALKLGKDRVIDARSEAEHTGLEKRAKRAGRVPTSCHLEWTQFVDTDGRFLDEAALRAKLAKAGVKPGEPVITHCQGGGRASVDAFVFERLGFPTRNYYLGWSDWGNAEDTPLESGPAKKAEPR